MKTQSMFALFLVTKGGCVIFDCSKVNFLVASELEYFLFTGSSPDSQMSDGEGNHWVGVGWGGRGVVEDLFEDTSCHQHEEDPDIGTRLWKMPEQLFVSETQGDRAASKQLSHVHAPVPECPVWQLVTERDGQGHMLIFQSMGHVSSHTPQDPRAVFTELKSLPDHKLMNNKFSPSLPSFNIFILFPGRQGATSFVIHHPSLSF